MPNPNNLDSIFSRQHVPVFSRYKMEIKAPVDDMTEIRKDLAEIKRLLTPSLILTGQQVIDEYRELPK